MKKLIFLLLLPVLTFANGTIIYTKGEVLLSDKVIKKGQSIKTGDLVKTQGDAIAVLRFENGNTVKLNENSELKIEALAESKAKGRTILNLIRGNSFFKKQKDTTNLLNVKAHSVSMGIRGTVFFVAYGEEVKDDVYMCVKEGVVAIKSGKEEKPTMVKEGQGVVAKKGLNTSAPRMLPWTKNLNWSFNEDTDLKNKAKIEESYGDILNKDYD